ncbi:MULTISPECIES: TetR/AcrR family transcriptional regulator [Adlercreutzia]|uniref:TetR/AcrR family transcriptional regulator n=1 Tax=Adlercreutzia TaxID=447020 RepID=UPI0003898116|nr:TetR/AcrR family transcriptional regulator [Adlercreutzia equolifaciens]RFT84728.1 TetR/AcrR family transcriptional regulator [Adlercreutzia equolifaciens]BAN77190.1 transcriptional regulator [Adlercreutzia equolifaciens DSM 19450]
MSRDFDVPCTDRRVRRTRYAIHSAFRALVARDGFRNITVSALAREANIDRKTFYLHYRGLDDLMAEEIRQIADQVAAALMPVSKGSAMAVNLRETLERVADLFLADREFFRSVFAEAPLDRVVEALVPAIRSRVIAQGVLPAFRDTAALDNLIRFYVGGVGAVFFHWFLGEDGGRDIDGMVDDVRRLVGEERFFSLE